MGTHQVEARSQPFGRIKQDLAGNHEADAGRKLHPQVANSVGGGFASGALVVSCAQGDWLKCLQTTNVKDRASTTLHGSN